ncbi:chitobiase/beta-hexosaminidase C-terminal domain-containing protein [Postechiella marina]|uniref:Chitobiase/beta-hexosaminidase C-terminal domain-containing protein n=2 Tax=Postechiella marina TaxID=943941 RepID=A0ABP8C5B0_9FLAO
MHPLVLHFPIAFIVLLAIFSFFKKQIEAETYKNINRFLIVFTAFTTVIATIMGLFLSMEGDTTDLMTLHKWFGVGICFLVYVLTFVKKEKVFNALLYVGVIGVVFVGHYGAGLTHGTNFITEPLVKTKVVKLNEETPIFQGFVKPVLDSKCLSCHNSEKRKGELDMSSFEGMMHGGKGGKLWIAGNPEKSALLKRVHLPEDNKKHMPPQGKKQLTKGEIQLINAWIKQGADNKIALAQLPEEDGLKQITSKLLASKNKSIEPVFAFNFAKTEIIDGLQNPFRSVIQKSPASPAIEVVINGRETYRPEFLTDLSSIKEQIVSLNLSFLPVDKSSIDFISSLSNLNNLLLNFTDVTTNDLSGLKTCVNLKTLSLSGTKVDVEIKDLLKQLPKLETLYLWNTEINNEAIDGLKLEFPNVHFETGFKSDGKALKLTPPVLLSEKTIISKGDFIELGHKMPGVEIRYTTDGTVPTKSSKLFKTPIQVDLKNKKPFKAIAYKKGWLASNVKTIKFIDKGYTPKQFEVTYEGENNEFIGVASRILIDHNKAGNGTANSTPSWAAFNFNNPLNALAYFGENPPTIKHIIFNYGVHKWSKTEPLATLEVWAGQDKNNLTLLKQIKKTPRKLKGDKKNQDIEDKRPRRLKIEVPKNKIFKYYKIIATPHKKSRIYVDQLYFY